MRRRQKEGLHSTKMLSEYIRDSLVRAGFVEGEFDKDNQLYNFYRIEEPQGIEDEDIQHIFFEAIQANGLCCMMTNWLPDKFEPTYIDGKGMWFEFLNEHILGQKPSDSAVQ